MARSPLIGNSGHWGEPWTPLGDTLIEGGYFESVIFVPTAIGGSSIARWSAGGDLNLMLQRVLFDVVPRLTITHVLWQQGETDFQLGTTAQAWQNGFADLVATLRHAQVNAPIFVAIASRCEKTGINWKPSNPITSAQRAVVDEARGIRTGVDADTLLVNEDRYDDCHLSASGIEKLVQGWANAITRAR